MIVMIGSGFYAGLDASAPDIEYLADTYYKEYNLLDFKIVSTMGLTDDDVAAIKAIDGITAVIPSYSADVLSGEMTLRIHALEDSVNKVKLFDGRLPEKVNECVADNRNYRVGDKIKVTSDVEDKLDITEFKVVGVAESVLYLAEDYGSTTIGNGKLSSFIFVDKDVFKMDVYTEIYIDADTENADAYSDKYDAISTRINDELVKIKPVRELARDNDISSEAYEEISENETKLNDERVKAQKELDDAKKELDDGAKELLDGKETARKEFADAKKELDDGSKELADGKAELLKNEKELNETVISQNAEFEDAKKQISDGWKQIDAGLEGTGITRDTIGATITELSAGIDGMNMQLLQIPEGSQEYMVLAGTISEYQKQLDGLNQLKTSIDTLTASEKQLNDGIATFNVEIENARKQITDAKTEIAENEKKIADGYIEYEESLAKIDKELAENEQKLEDGYKEYYEGLEEFNSEMADAEKKISDAKQEVADLKPTTWYIYDRNASVGHDELGSSIEVIVSIAAVFPIFFILIVMLMSSNSMSRMIAEERGELGTLASLGFDDNSIVRTYLLYVLSASGIGAVAGFFIGCRLIPPLVFSNFVYVLPPLVMQYNMVTFAIIMVVAFVLMIFVTYTSCNKELKHTPATLMRPLPPKKGKKILLERIGFIWNRLSFTWKVTMRNMFRYKKRAMMTIVGVAGCTALLVVGFGLRDSMDGVAEKQYGEIQTYKSMIILDEETKHIDGDLLTLIEKEKVTNPLLIKQSPYKCETPSKSVDVYMIVPQDNEVFENYYNLTGKSDGIDIPLNDDTVIITEKFAATFSLKEGSTFSISDADKNVFELTVSDIVENYISNYIYMNTTMYNKVFCEDIMFNTVVSDSVPDAKRLIEDDQIITVSLTSDAVDKILENNASLDSIVIFLVVVASLLAIIVLYNLTAINISERIREIATLKVLGFNDGETNAYIYREAIILTFVSIIIGAVLGTVLHGFVVDVIESDVTVLFRKISLFSYGLSCVLTIVFSIIMQFVTYFKLQKIDMIESLKSVE